MIDKFLTFPAAKVLKINDICKYFNEKMFPERKIYFSEMYRVRKIR